jgi:hypothetical protein
VARLPFSLDGHGGRGDPVAEGEEPAGVPPLRDRPERGRLSPARLPELRGDYGRACASRLVVAGAGSRRMRMQMRGSQDRIASCTTTHWDGLIAVISPETSWVARWQRTCACPPPPALCRPWR